MIVTPDPLLNIMRLSSSSFSAYQQQASSLLASQNAPMTPMTATLHSEEEASTLHLSMPAVQLELSPEAQKMLAEAEGDEQTEEGESTEKSSKTGMQKGINGKELTQEERDVIQKLRSRDAEVRAHENAHISAAGGLASGPSFSYQSGPDGKRYAIGGHVNIDTSPGKDPQETLMKAERIRSAALSPADPSPQDRAVASQASQMAASARAQIAAEKTEEAQKAQEERAKKEQEKNTEDAPTAAQKAYGEFQNPKDESASEIDLVA